MPLEMQCNMCGVTIPLSDSQAGTIIRCSSCGQVIFVQHTSEEPESGAAQPGSGDALQPADAALPEFVEKRLTLEDSATAPPDEVFRSSLAEMVASSENPSLETCAPGESYGVMSSSAPNEPIRAGPEKFEPPAEDGTRDSAAPQNPDFVFHGFDAQTSHDPAVSATTVPTTSRVQSGKTKPSLGLIVGIYVSGVIFGLIIGKFLFSRPPLTGLELIRDDGTSKHKTQWVIPTAPVPETQQKKLGETVELGHLAVTALGIEKQRVVLERIDPFSGDKETTTSPDDCLVLHVRLKNTSRNVTFTPLDETFLRPHEPRRRPTYSFIELEGGKQIKMYELAQFSEWNIVGQPFEPVKPGEEIDAIIAAANGSADEAKGRMLWRIQVRAGGTKNNSYSTVVGFAFTPDEIRM